MKVLIRIDTDDHPALLGAIKEAIEEIRQDGLSKPTLRNKGRNVWVREYSVEFPFPPLNITGKVFGKISLWITEIKGGVSITGIYKEEQ